jgi:hypothetical protein
MDETIEEDVIEEVNEQIIEEPIKQPINSTNPINGGGVMPSSNSRLSFNNIDYVKTEDGNVSNINAPKTIERLEEISDLRYHQRKMEDEDDNDDSNSKLNISGEAFTLDSLDIHNIEEPKLELLPDLLIDEIEVLE